MQLGKKLVSATNCLYNSIERAQMPTRTFIDMPKSGVFAPRPFERRKTQTKTQKFKDKFVEVLTMGLRGHAEPDNPDFLKSEEDLSPELKSLPPKKNTFGRKISMEEYQEKLKEVERKPLEDRAKVLSNL